MELDDDRELGSLFPSQDVFIEKMLRIQHHVVARSPLSHWAHRLRYLEVPEIDGNEILSKPRITLNLTDKAKFPGAADYVVVSYCWNSFDQDPICRSPRYYVQTNSGIRPCRAPEDVLDRAIGYALRHGVSKIWIDQECIDQEDPQDLEHGVQCMDVVYSQGCHPIGLLSAQITDQTTFEAFRQLLSHAETAYMFKDPPWNPAPEPHVVAELMKVLCSIARDRWFYRCWTYQEATCSRDAMKMLIRGGPGNDSSGDFSFRLSALWKASSWLWDCEQKVLGRRSEIPGWSTMAGLCMQAWEQGRRCSRPCDYEVAHMLGQRRNLVVADRLAITANLCGYTKRLEPAPLISEGLSYSICALGLALLNGSIHPQGCSDMFECSGKPRITWRSKNIHQLLESPRHVSHVYGNARQNEPRFPQVTLGAAGLETWGWLWNVERKVCLPRSQARHVQLIRKGSFASEEELSSLRTALIDIIDELRQLNYPSIADSLTESMGRRAGVRYMDFCDEFTMNPFREAPLIKGMIKKILRQGYVWCGAISGEDELKGVFDVNMPGMVFTSIDVPFNDIARPLAANNFLCFGISRLEDQGGIQRLRHSATSVNGIWFPAESPAKRYMFPWGR